MPHIIDPEPDAVWKAQLRGRIMKNLDGMLQEVHASYKAKLATSSSTSSQGRYRLELEYKRDLQNLQSIAEEDLRAAIEREEQERKWDAQAPWQNPEDLDHSIIEEQVAILNQIRNQSGRVQHGGVQEYNGAYFQQGSSSRPFDEPSSPVRARSGSTAGLPYSHYTPPTVQTVQVDSAADREARLRAEKHEKQQAEFRKRAEAIQQRKRQERQWNNQINWTETMSSSSSTTSASDNEATTPTEEVAKADSITHMSEEDIVNLVVFHDQQWAFMSSLPHLQWGDFPWPVLSFSSPKRKEDLTLEAVVEYIFAPLTDTRDRAVVKDRLKDLIRRWHPDRFETKYLALIADLREREMVREGAGVVARILNDLLGKWNDL
ncbi:hypothetical protein GALMADRAFT_130926 [Galerina marginata CBS 339.88]|uniref:Uncharacterized protein n=1 Tax=Galerina marginata (strain CBS 339.88) TaxID=685588 RepID=A0A067S973_GALM3|nr:hypothetical protein GALMADRAFT_130926 [Galerina marginata CBS 339.88]